jgi:arginine deiminase
MCYNTLCKLTRRWIYLGGTLLRRKPPFFRRLRSGTSEESDASQPGKELERLPSKQDDSSSTTSSGLKRAERTRRVAEMLRDDGVEVVYFKNCLAQILRDEEVRSPPC